MNKEKIDEEKILQLPKFKMSEILKELKQKIDEELTNTIKEADYESSSGSDSG